MYIYIQRERERERMRKKERERERREERKKERYYLAMNHSTILASIELLMQSSRSNERT